MMRVLHVIRSDGSRRGRDHDHEPVRAIDRSKVQFDFVVHEERECDYDAEYSRSGAGYSAPRASTARTALRTVACSGPFRLPSRMGRRPRAYRKLCRGLPFRGEARRLRRHRPQPCPKHTLGVMGLAFRALSYPTRHVADWFLGCSDEACVDRFGEDGAGRQVLRLAQRHRPVALRLRRRGVRDRVRGEARRDGRSVFCHVGRFTEVKNHAFLLEVFSLVKAELPQAVLLLAGRGASLRRRCASTCESAAWGSVRFLGVRDDICDVLQACDVFVFPSRKEGLAIAVVEAQASGCRVSSRQACRRLNGFRRVVHIDLSEPR